MQTPASPSRIKCQKTGIKTLARILFASLLPLLAGTPQLLAQAGPGVTMRFANPEYDFSTETYCVDVEFISATDGVEVSGINARFFFDDNLLEFVEFSDFQGGYGRANVSPVVVDNTGDGGFFAFQGDALFINEAIEIVNEGASPILLSDTEWTMLFRACFVIKDEEFLEIDEFCPSLVWDMQSNPDDKSFLAGSEGLVITVAGENECILASEEVEQFNWAYGDTDGIFGAPETDPDQLDCISTRSIPLGNISLFITLFLVTLFVVLRKRPI